jgi:hypothetical protein
MKKAILAVSVLTLVATTAGCSSQRHTTTTTRETVQPIPEEPVTIQKRTTTHTETRTTD